MAQYNRFENLKIASNSFVVCLNRGQFPAAGFSSPQEDPMKLAALALATLSLAAAGSAAAATHVSDVDYLRANRCKGLAQGLGEADAVAGLGAFIKQQGATRLDAIIERGDEEFTRAKRESSRVDTKARDQAEFSSACTAYMDSGKADTAAAR
jgi:hypothetical protein